MAARTIRARTRRGFDASLIRVAQPVEPFSASLPGAVPGCPPPTSGIVTSLPSAQPVSPTGQPVESVDRATEPPRRLGQGRWDQLVGMIKEKTGETAEAIEER